jgi:cysteinyl-tRNA synthetase
MGVMMQQTGTDLRLYNTLTRKVERFDPLHPPVVTIYACGPTVWNYAHIGNFRTFLLTDILRRYLAYRGFDVFLVMNLTDVDDRLIKGAAEAGVTVRELTEKFVRAFFEDRDYLRIRPADVYPRATEYIGPMVALVERLLERGLAYKGEDGSVYYSVAKFPRYGLLSQLDRRELKVGARVASDEYSKDDVRDFAMWKAASDVDERVGAAWDAPFGRGRPGWHLECSAMALTEVERRVEAETVDIHMGAVDLVFPHHENEIAQAEGATGKPFARHWVHGEFLEVGGTKMSKRFGNVLTVRDLREEGVDGATFRMFVCSAHYRQKLNFTDEALAAAAEASRRLADSRERLVTAAAEAAEAAGAAGAAEEVSRMESGFRGAMDDDLNVPEAVAAVFTFVRVANRRLDERAWDAAAATHALAAFDRVMGVLDVLPTPREADRELAAWVEAKIAERQEARRARDFSRADAIRDEVQARGIELIDAAEGTRWKTR